MSHKRMRAAMLLALCAATTQAQAQAPATAQVWDVRFVVDSSGPFAAGPTATQVGITIFARVGILPGTWSQNNFGVNRVGGIGGALSIEFRDVAGAAQGGNQGEARRGRTADIDGRGLTDTAGDPLAGHFSPFRGSFSPQVGPLFVGSNTDPFNGEYLSTPAGAPSVTSIVGSRTVHFGSEGSGPVGVASAPDADPANLVGDLAPVYRMYYLPRADLPGPRPIELRVTGLSARYVVMLVPLGGASSPFNLPDQTITFQVPAPGTAAFLLGTAALLARRRR